MCLSVMSHPLYDEMDEMEAYSMVLAWGIIRFDASYIPAYRVLTPRYIDPLEYQT